MNDRLIGVGPLIKNNFQPGVLFGDVSKFVSGSARLRQVRVALTPELPPELAKAATPEKWDINLDFSAGIPKRDGLRSTYPAKAISVSDGGTVLDNETDNKFAAIDITKLFGDRLPGRKITVEWEAEAVRVPAVMGDTNFLMLLRAQKADGSKAGELFIRVGTDRIISNCGTFPISGKCRLRAVADPVSGIGAVFLNDCLMGVGPLIKNNFQPGVLFGDVSKFVSGSALLRKIRAALTD